MHPGGQVVLAPVQPRNHRVASETRCRPVLIRVFARPILLLSPRNMISSRRLIARLKPPARASYRLRLEHRKGADIQAVGHKRTSLLFEYLISTQHERLRQLGADRLGGLEIDY